MASMSEGNPAYAAQDWVHLCTWDYFAGQWVYMQGLKNRVFTAHSLLLIFNSGARPVTTLLTRRVQSPLSCQAHLDFVLLTPSTRSA